MQIQFQEVTVNNVMGVIRSLLGDLVRIKSLGIMEVRCGTWFASWTSFCSLQIVWWPVDSCDVTSEGKGPQF